MSEAIRPQSPPAALPARHAGRGVRAAVRRWAVSQFRRPTGFWGGVAGRIMARRASNRERSRWTVALLDVQPADWVLEIGFGPGLALGWAAEKASAGLVMGVDHSEVMLRQAARRHARAIEEGHVVLQLGAVERMPDLGVGFDRILAVNVAQFWAQPAAPLRGLRERLRPGGRIALTVQPRNRGATEADATRTGERLAAALREAGFRNVRVERLPLRPVSAVCALGER